MQYFNFEYIKGDERFKLGPHKALMRTLEDFYGATVRLVFNPMETFKNRYNIDITANPKKELYRVDGIPDMVLLVIYAEQGDSMFYLGIQLDSPLMQYYDTSIFHSTCINVGRKLKEASERSFRSCLSLFNESLAKEIVIGNIGKGSYDISKVSYLVDMFLGLRSATFEGKHFSTGLILTKSLFAFSKAEKFDKEGKFIRLSSGKMNVDITDRQNIRFWYLVDGYHTFYLTDLKKTLNSVFLYDGGANDYVSEMLLSKTLQGADALFRVSNGRELSVVDSDGQEFLHLEKCWKYRDYNALKQCVMARVPHVAGFYDMLIRCVLDCSKSDTSSIIWLPKDINTIDNIVLEKSKNVFSDKLLNFNDEKNQPIVKRLLSSDGATVIDANGKIRYFGCIADISKATAGGIKGTGETAASLLAQNGMAIKISQDGPIKIFIEGMDGYIPF